MPPSMPPQFPRDIQVPVGGVILYLGPASAAETQAQLAMIGWLVCDGRSVQAATYPALYMVIGETFGGDGAGTFNLPDFTNEKGGGPSTSAPSVYLIRYV